MLSNLKSLGVGLFSYSEGKKITNAVPHAGTLLGSVRGKDPVAFPTRPMGRCRAGLGDGGGPP